MHKIQSLQVRKDKYFINLFFLSVPQQGPDPCCAGCLENVQWKTQDTVKSSFQKEVKKEDFHSNEPTSSYFCVCVPSAILLWELLVCGTQHPFLTMGAPYFDTAGYSAPFGISGIRGGMPFMIDCLNEKNYDKNPRHEMRPLWMVTGSAHSL